MPWGYAAAGIATTVVGSALAGSPPDYSGSIASSSAATERVANRQLDLAERQYADQQALLDEYSPYVKQQIQQSVEQQAKQIQQSDQQWSDYQQYFSPVEQALATKSLNYDTPEKRAAAVQKAQADVGMQYANADQSLSRDLGRSNLSLSAGKALALAAGSKLQQAKDTTAAAQTAQQQIEDKGMAYLDNAARFGRNLPSTGIETASQANTSGNTSTSQIGALSSLTSAPASSASGLLSSAASTYGSVASQQLGLANNQLSAWNAKTQLMTDAAGSGMTLYGSYAGK